MMTTTRTDGSTNPLNIFAARGYDFGGTLVSGCEASALANRGASEHGRSYGKYDVEGGYAAYGYGTHRAKLRGPRRETLEEAEHDARAPERCIWRVTGYICG